MRAVVLGAGRVGAAMAVDLARDAEQLGHHQHGGDHRRTPYQCPPLFSRKPLSHEPVLPVHIGNGHKESHIKQWNKESPGKCRITYQFLDPEEIPVRFSGVFRKGRIGFLPEGSIKNKGHQQENRGA